MLIWEPQGGGKDSTIRGLGDRVKVNSMIRREHGELELDSVCWIDLEGC